MSTTESEAQPTRRDPQRVVMEIQTRDGSLVRVIPITADTPHGPLLTIVGNGGQASVQVDPHDLGSPAGLPERGGVIMASQHGQGQEEALATVSDVARLRGIALLAAAQVHQRVDYHGSSSTSYDSTASDEAVVSSAVRFAQFLRDGR